MILGKLTSYGIPERYNKNVWINKLLYKLVKFFNKDKMIEINSFVVEPDENSNSNYVFDINCKCEVNKETTFTPSKQLESINSVVTNFSNTRLGDYIVIKQSYTGTKEVKTIEQFNAINKFPEIGYKWKDYSYVGGYAKYSHDDLTYWYYFFKKQ